MSWLLPLLRSKFAALGAVLVIALLIAIGGPMIIGSRYRIWCWILAALIIIGYLIYLLIQKLRAKKNAKMLEGFLNQQADDQVMSARPDVQDELAAIKEKLNRALDVLKHSKMARGRRGAEALYVLPWYMIIGPSASGKSTAVRNSGLHFPPVDPDSEDPGKVKGLGGTRNCDWWFSNEGILLDTAGRYTISADVQEDREEWTSFLDMLRKARPRAPINGLILAISVDELLRMDADGLESHARALRSRIDELIIKLEILFPVYLVFTKCDLVSGFVEFFGGMSRGDREQVWGYTRKNEPPRGSLGEEFEREFDDLTELLRRRRIPQLVSEISPTQKRGIYMFPVEFGAARKKLSSFIDTLFRPNPYQQNPMVRGVYFTSGTQEGTPIAQVIAEIGRNFGIASDHVAQAAEIKETKAYFIRDLFQEVILPDESLVYPTTRAWRRRRLLKTLAIAGQVILLVLLGLALITSHNNNRRANASLAETARYIGQATRNATSFELDPLYELDRLREELVAVETHKPLMRRWGLYSGDVVADAARRLYFDRYNAMALMPTARSLELSLQTEFGCEDEQLFDEQYSRFRAYRMLTLPYDSIPKSPLRLEKQMITTWGPVLGEDRESELRSVVERQVAYYWTHRSNPDIPNIQVRPNRSLIARVNEQVNQCWTPERLYQMLISDINDNMRRFGYPDAVYTIYLDGDVVGGAFTREGWEQFVRPRIDSIPIENRRDPVREQVFGSIPDEQLQKSLTDMYVADFVSVWKNFILSGHVTPFTSIAAGVMGTEELAQDPFPIIKVLDRVYDQSEITAADGSRFRRIEDEFRELGRFLGRGGNVPEGTVGKDRYIELLAGLPSDLQDIETSLEASARCGEHFREFTRKLDEYERRVNSIISSRGIARDARGLLRQPFEVVRGAVASSACDCLDRAWKEQVWNDYNLSLASVYPFNHQAEANASSGQATDFFRSLQSFIQNEVEPARDFIRISSGFEQAVTIGRRISQILRPGSTDQVMFTLEAAGLSGIRRVHFQYANLPEWVYVAGQPQQRQYKWPQPGGGNCKLWIEAIENVFYQRKEFSGDWGIFKFFDEAERRPGGRLAWKFESQGGPTLEVQLKLSGSHAQFIRDGHFTQFRCPETVCR